VQLSIDLPGNQDGLTALADVLNTVSALPGAAMTTMSPRPLPRQSTKDTQDTRSGRLRIRLESRTVLRDGEPLDLTRLEFDLLEFLATRPNQVHRRGALMAEVWGVAEVRGSRTVDVHVRRLRDKLGPYRTVITTVRGVGYRFDGSPQVVLDRGPSIVEGH
jgi:DNA-binding response OmpR family regulator